MYFIKNYYLLKDKNNDSPNDENLKRNKIKKIIRILLEYNYLLFTNSKVFYNYNNFAINILAQLIENNDKEGPYEGLLFLNY